MRKILLAFIYFVLSFSLFANTGPFETDDPLLSSLPEDDCEYLQPHLKLKAVQQQEIKGTVVFNATTADGEQLFTEEANPFVLWLGKQNNKMQEKYTDGVRKSKETTEYFAFSFPIQRATQNFHDKDKGFFSYSKMILENFIILPFYYEPVVLLARFAIPAVTKTALGIPHVAMKAAYHPFKKKPLEQKMIVKGQLVEKEMISFIQDVQNKKYSSAAIEELYQLCKNSLPESKQKSFSREEFFNVYLSGCTFVFQGPMTYYHFKRAFVRDFYQEYMSKNS